MIRHSRLNFWYLAFNQKAKARPNFGLKGVGIYQANTAYSQSPWAQFVSCTALVGFIATLFALNKLNITEYLAEHVDGGPRLMVTEEMEEALAAKPWEFKFLPGEGYAEKPRYLETGIPLDHLKNTDIRQLRAEGKI